MQNILPIPITLAVVTECWEKAEAALRRSIKQKHQDSDEEFITRLFLDEFRYVLRRASDAKRISQAFLKDLQKNWPGLAGQHQWAVISENLVADVSLHRRSVEKVTGGDFGLTVTRPQVSLHPLPNLIFSSHESLPVAHQIEMSEYQRGLLCQAKLKHKDGKWNELTDKQKILFPERADYYGLLLYQYSDEERRKLGSFSWQLCRHETVETVTHWLKSGEFPSISSSADIIAQLGNAAVGTDDHETLEKIIRPTGKPHIVITVSWPDGKRPPDLEPVYLESPNILAQQQQQQQLLHTYVYVNR
jgi:hypothetical protein